MDTNADLTLLPLNEANPMEGLSDSEIAENLSAYIGLMDRERAFIEASPEIVGIIRRSIVEAADRLRGYDEDRAEEARETSLQSQDEASGCDFNASGKHTDDDDGDCPCGYKWPPVQAQPQDVASSAEEMPAALEPRAAASDAATAAHRYVQSVIDCADVWTEEWAENVFIAGWRQATLQANGPVEITDEMVARAQKRLGLVLASDGQIDDAAATRLILEAAING